MQLEKPEDIVGMFVGPGQEFYNTTEIIEVLRKFAKKIYPIEHDAATVANHDGNRIWVRINMETGEITSASIG